MKNMVRECTGVILAGGENRRMPTPKAFITIEGEKIIERSLRTMKRLFGQIFIVTDKPADFVYLGVPLLGDVYNVRGPMTGIITAMICSSQQWVFVAACDMPFLQEDLIRYTASQRKGCDAVIPLLNGKVEPLFAFYSMSLLPTMEEAVRSGSTGLKDFLKRKRVKYFSENTIREIDPALRSFVNVNTPEDLEVYT